MDEYFLGADVWHRCGCGLATRRRGTAYWRCDFRITAATHGELCKYWGVVIVVVGGCVSLIISIFQFYDKDCSNMIYSIAELIETLKMTRGLFPTAILISFHVNLKKCLGKTNSQKMPNSLQKFLAFFFSQKSKIRTSKKYQFLKNYKYFPKAFLIFLFCVNIYITS